MRVRFAGCHVPVDPAHRAARLLRVSRRMSSTALPLGWARGEAGAVPGHGPARLTWPDLQAGVRGIVPVPRPAQGSPALLARWRLKRPGSDETIFPRPRSRPEMNPGYQRPRIKRRGFELFSNDQSSKRSDLRIRRLHAVRPRHRLFRRTGLMRRGTVAPRAAIEWRVAALRCPFGRVEPTRLYRGANRRPNDRTCHPQKKGI
jgi:hypothetical protein